MLWWRAAGGDGSGDWLMVMVALCMVGLHPKQLGPLATALGAPRISSHLDIVSNGRAPSTHPLPHGDHMQSLSI